MDDKKRLIDANALLRVLNPIAWESVYIRADEVIGEIKCAPTIDAVEVVRCKDCKHYRPRNISAHWEHKALCCARSAWIKFPEDGFCSYRERKDNEHKL